MNACIMMKTVPTKTLEVAESVRKIAGVMKAYVVYGRWDLVAFAKFTEYRHLMDLTAKINSLEGVRSTETLAEA